MKPLDGISETLDIQLGLNMAFIHVLSTIAMTVAMKLPKEEQLLFNNTLASLAEDEGCVGDLSPRAKKSFGMVISQVTKLTSAIASSD